MEGGGQQLGGQGGGVSGAGMPGQRVAIPITVHKLQNMKLILFEYLQQEDRAAIDRVSLGRRSSNFSR